MSLIAQGLALSPDTHEQVHWINTLRRHEDMRSETVGPLTLDPNAHNDTIFVEDHFHP